jgi:hypothetical protein
MQVHRWLRWDAGLIVAVAFFAIAGLRGSFVEAADDTADKKSPQPVVCVFDGGRISDFKDIRAYVQRAAERVAVGEGKDRDAVKAHVEKQLKELDASRLLIIDNVTVAEDGAKRKVELADRETPRYVVHRERQRNASGENDDKPLERDSLLITLRSLSPVIDPNSESEKAFILEVEVSEVVEKTDRNGKKVLETNWIVNSTRRVHLHSADGDVALPLAAKEMRD